MLYEFQFSKLCLKHICPPLNVNTPETWLLLPGGSMVTQPTLSLHSAADWVSGLPFVSTHRVFSWPWGGVDALIRSDDFTLYMVTAMHQQKAKLADAQLPACGWVFQSVLSSGGFLFFSLNNKSHGLGPLTSPATSSTSISLYL